MGDAAVEYEARAAIQLRLEQARRVQGFGITRPAFWRGSVFLSIVALIVVGAVMHAALHRPPEIAGNDTRAASYAQEPGDGSTRSATTQVGSISGSKGIAASSAVDSGEGCSRLGLADVNCGDVSLPTHDSITENTPTERNRRCDGVAPAPAAAAANCADELAN